MEFNKKDLYNMLESYQNFCCRGIEITSEIHANGPDMCRQLIKMLDERDNLVSIINSHVDYRIILLNRSNELNLICDKIRGLNIFNKEHVEILKELRNAQDELRRI